MSSLYNGFWSQTNPGAGTTLASWTTDSIHTYKLDITAYLSGTLVGGDADNLGVYLNGSLQAQIPLPGVANTPVSVTLYLIADTSDVIAIKNIASGGILATYKGLMSGSVK